LSLLTKFSQFLYDWSPLRKEILPEYIFDDILQAFITNHPGIISGELVCGDYFICVLKMPPELDTLQLRIDWSNAFYVHGYHGPLLDIQWITE
jgi:hypothetical protein